MVLAQEVAAEIAVAELGSDKPLGGWRSGMVVVFMAVWLVGGGYLIWTTRNDPTPEVGFSFSDLEPKNPLSAPATLLEPKNPLADPATLARRSTPPESR